MKINDPRFKKQLDFILEIDRLKRIRRQTLLTDATRKENSAEHSWQLAVMVMVLSEYAERDVEVEKVLKMVLIHDLVEIDAGDTYAYNFEAREDKKEREREAAERIFGLLPADQAEEFRALWEEFEALETPEARFANAVDRVQPLIHNYSTNGESWREHGIRCDEVLEQSKQIKQGSTYLWEYAKQLIETAVEQQMFESNEKQTTNC